MKALDLALLAVSDDAGQLLHDALVNHGYVIAALAGLIVLVPIVLKALGKDVPGLDPILEVVVSVLKSFNKPKDAAAAVPPTDAEKAAQPGTSDIAKVVDINTLSADDKKKAGL